VAAPRASWSMITFRLVCALAVVAETEDSATMAMTVSGTILFRPMAMIDPLVLLQLKIIGGWFPLVVFRWQDTCGTNGAYSSQFDVSQGKTAD
jgi:hypothetical protein